MSYLQLASVSMLAKVKKFPDAPPQNKACGRFRGSPGGDAGARGQKQCVAGPKSQENKPVFDENN